MTSHTDSAKGQSAGTLHPKWQIVANIEDDSGGHWTLQQCSRPPGEEWAHCKLSKDGHDSSPNFYLLSNGHRIADRQDGPRLKLTYPKLARQTELTLMACIKPRIKESL